MATTNYNWTLPTVGASTDTWGTVLNTAIEDIDSDLFTVAGTITGKLTAASNLSDVADAAIARTNLGLTIGSNVQAYDAGLASIAGLTTVANRGIYTTDADVYATYNLTAAGRSFVGQADAAAMRTYLGLGTMALENTADYGTLAQQDTVNNADWSGTALSLANGGTGATTAAGARAALELGALATEDEGLVQASDTSKVGAVFTANVSSGASITLPSGGTWAYFTVAMGSSASTLIGTTTSLSSAGDQAMGVGAGTVAGGTSFVVSTASFSGRVALIAFRVA